ncbi:HD-GYP domain-containing protein [Fusibacter sp. JL298sf-3]
MFNKITIEPFLLKSLVTMGSVIEARDKYTGGHVYRVGQYAAALGKHMHLGDDEIFLLELGGLIHDIGKVGTPDSVLNKKDKLTDVEYALMKKHASLGRTLIQDHPLEHLVIDMVGDHHERLDGKGYPDAKSAHLLTENAKIMAVADAFDAMTSERPYRKGMPPEVALKVLRENIGTQFDADLVARMEKLYALGALEGILNHAGFGRRMLDCPACGPIIAPTSEHADGDHLVCPACAGEFQIHKHGETFELMFTERRIHTHEPKPDVDAINYLVKVRPKAIKRRR